MWDGKTLAADKQATNGNLARTTTKIWRDGDILMGGVGGLAALHAVRAWAKAGMKQDDFPKIEKDDDLTFYVIPKVGPAVKFEGTACPMPVEDKWFAEGTGRDFAYGALEAGAGAYLAVEITCKHDIYCGRGIDTLTFN